MIPVIFTRHRRAAAVTYLLRDEFTDTRAAGEVNGTAATPGPGTRTVTDTTSKLSVGSGVLSVAGGKTSPANGDPGMWFPSVVRSAGKLVVNKINFTTMSVGNSVLTGFGSAQSGAVLSNSIGINNSGLFLRDGTNSPNVGNVLSLSTDYYLATVLRSTGAYHFIKGGEYTNWTFLGMAPANSTTTLYPGTSNYNGIFTSDYIRIPTATFLPTPLAYDTFTRSDGAIGSSETTGPDGQTTPSLAWTGGAISSNKLVITPSLGSELIVNGGFDTDTDWTKGTDWQISGGKASHVSPYTYSTIYQPNVLTTGGWYQAIWTFLDRTNNSAAIQYGGSGSMSTYKTTNATFTETGRAVGTSFLVLGNGSWDGSVDNVSVKPLTLSSLFSSVSTSDKDVVASADIVMTAGTQAGLVTNLDSTSSPANFLIAYHDGTEVYLDKCVGGVYTTLINTAATYSAGATLRVITYTSGGSLKVRVYYNNVFIGTEQTVSDAGIISNTKHGLFSTYSANTFDNYTLFARGSEGQYAALDGF